MIAPGALAAAAMLLAAGAVKALPCAHIEAQARTGDLLFRAERSLISTAVMQAQRDWRYSHVGLVLEAGGRKWVRHAEYSPAAGTDGVIDEDVCTYVRRATRLELRRFAALDAAARQSVAAVAARIGRPAFNLTLNPAPADGSVYCTQYVRRVFDTALPGLLPPEPAAGPITVTRLLDASGSRRVAAWADDKDTQHAQAKP